MRPTVSPIAGCGLLCVLGCVQPLREEPVEDPSAVDADGAAKVDAAVADPAGLAIDGPSAAHLDGAVPSGTDAGAEAATARVPVITMLDLSVSFEDFALGPDGKLWFAMTDAIGRVSEPGKVSRFPLPDPIDPMGRGAGGLAVGPDGNVWFRYGRAKIGRITPAGVIREVVALQGETVIPTNIAAGPDENLWITDSGSNAILRLTTAGALTRFALPDQLRPWSIVAGMDGNLWFNEYGGRRLGRMTTGGALTVYTAPSEGAYILRVASGPDGNVWFTEQAGRIGRIKPDGSITEFPIPSGDADPLSITGGPDGNLWFTEYRARRIGRITPSGAVTEIPLSGRFWPGGIVAGPPGTIFFSMSPFLGRIDL